MPKFYFEIITLGFIDNPPTCTQANFTTFFINKVDRLYYDILCTQSVNSNYLGTNSYNIINLYLTVRSPVFLIKNVVTTASRNERTALKYIIIFLI